MDTQEATENLTGHWEAIPQDVRTEALNGQWYRASKRVARRLARKHGVPLRTAAGVLAALSPRVRWSTNVAAADKLLGGAPNEEVAGYNTNVEKARRIAKGEEPDDVLGGDKVRAFYSAIMGDDDAAVVDVWMWRAIGCAPGGMSYNDAAAALRDAAAQAGLGVADFQAVVWTHMRSEGYTRSNGVYVTPEGVNS